ncbi:MAG: maleylpyruvate isomerase N-terminal domain-containing protein [Devosia sp.]|nr:maleylpyruvate isomerase N-terminal domain-containing protein [Devosia sp.]
MALDELSSARAELRARQGLGARYDAPNAPALELDWARRGTAYFARKLNELVDADLDAPSLVDGWSRREVVASVGYHARALTRITERARTGSDLHMFSSPGQRAGEIADGATLPPGALRHLVAHADVHLNVEWRDLGEADWDRPLETGRGKLSTARETPWMRACEVWLRALDIGGGGSMCDLPPAFLRALIVRRASLLGLVATTADGPASDRMTLIINGRTVAGRSGRLAEWLFGYGAAELASEGDLPIINVPDRRNLISEYVR